MVELHIILKAFTLKVCKTLLGVGVVDFRALYASEIVEECSSWGRAGSSSRATVDVVVAEDAIPLEQFNV